MGKKNTSNPDMSAAIQAMAASNAQATMYNADRMHSLGMAQIGAQIIQSQQMSADREFQAQTNLILGLERLDTKVQIAKMNFMSQMDKQLNTHVERMTELGQEMDEADANAQYQVRTGWDQNFYNDAGGYDPQDALEGLGEEPVEV